MNLLSLVSSAFTPISNTIDELHTSDEERAKAHVSLLTVQSSLAVSALEYEQKLTAAQAKVITAEANGQSWLQRSWRPITMLTFLVLIVCDSFGMLEFRLSEQAWELLKIGLGGYVIGRSAEKVAPAVVKALRK